jgi:hypothetical protein
MSRQVLGLWPSSGAISSTLRPSKIRRLAKLPRRSRGIVSSGRPTARAAGWKTRLRQFSQSSPVHLPTRRAERGAALAAQPNAAPADRVERLLPEPLDLVLVREAPGGLAVALGEGLPVRKELDRPFDQVVAAHAQLAHACVPGLDLRLHLTATDAGGARLLPAGPRTLRGLASGAPAKPRGRQGPWTSGGDYCSIPQPPGRSMPFVMSTVPPSGR